MSLPAETRIGRVVLQIADLERSLGFYRDVLGFREIRRRHETGGPAAELGAIGQGTVWLELREKRGARRVPRGGLLGLYHFAILLPSLGHLGRFFTHAVNAGAQVASANHLVSDALYLTDPDGLTVEVYRDRSRSEWGYSDGQISMATLPLDIDALVEAGTEAPEWRGLPEGTTIGHMHFYVGDLTAADAFYHRALGFDPMVWSYPGALFVSAGGYHHHVGLNTWASHTRVATDDDAKLMWWELILPTQRDIEETGDRLRAAGCEVTETSDGSFEALDPWAIRVRLAHVGQGLPPALKLRRTAEAFGEGWLAPGAPYGLKPVRSIQVKVQAVFATSAV